MSDRTKPSVTPLGIRTAIEILTPTPYGIGSAIQWAIAIVRDFAAQLMPDEDGNHDPELVERVAESLVFREELVLAALRSSVRGELMRRAVAVLDAITGDTE